MNNSEKSQISSYRIVEVIIGGNCGAVRMSGPSERDSGVTGLRPGQYANAQISANDGNAAPAPPPALAVPLTYISPNDATLCGQRVPKHARYTFDRSTKVSIVTEM